MATVERLSVATPASLGRPRAGPLSVALTIRELEQALRAAVALTDSGEIRLEHLSEAIRTHASPSLAPMRPEEQVLRERVIELLREHGGNVAAVGRALGKAPIQIRRWCHRMQIDLSHFRT